MVIYMTLIMANKEDEEDEDDEDDEEDDDDSEEKESKGVIIGYEIGYAS